MACSELFWRIEESSEVPEPDRTRYEVTVSMLEIYNEHIYDLFIDPKDRPKEGLKIRETKDGEIYVENLREVYVTSYDDIANQIERGTSNRTIAYTNMNATSSRAHTVVTISFK